MNEVNIGEIVFHGFAFDPKNAVAADKMDLNELFQSVPQLFDLLEQRRIDFVLVGGIAMLVYVDGRNTQDIDLIVPPDALTQLPELQVVDQQGEFVRAKLGHLQIDLLLTSNKLFEKVRGEHTQLCQAVGRKIPCATVEGLLLLKLFALPALYRQGQFDRVEFYERDISMLLRNFQPNLQPVLSELSNHLLDSDLDEITRILTEIENRIATSKNRFANDPSKSKNRPPEANH